MLLVASNTVGNVFLALGMAGMPVFTPATVFSYSSTFLTNFWLLGGMALLAVWMIAQLTMFTWADMSYVLPMTASAYVFTAILGGLFLHDKITAVRWAGIALISLGVILVADTPVSTIERPKEEEAS